MHLNPQYLSCFPDRPPSSRVHRLVRWISAEMGLHAVRPCPYRDDATLCANSATSFETHGGLLRRPREPIAEHHAHGAESGL